MYLKPFLVKFKKYLIGLIILIAVCLNFFMLNKVISSTKNDKNINENILLHHE